MLPDRGQVFACRAESAAQVVQTVRRSSDSRIPDFCEAVSGRDGHRRNRRDAVIRAGATGLSLINTLLGLVIDTTTMRPTLAGTTGGLSGPAIRPVALRCVWQVQSSISRNPPSSGWEASDPVETPWEFLLAGATAVSVGTAIFHDPSAPESYPLQSSRRRGAGARIRSRAGRDWIPRIAPMTATSPSPTSAQHATTAQQESSSLEDWDFITE